MSGFLRPGAAATLEQWRDVLIALAVIALGLWLAWRPGMIVPGFGWVLAALGAIGLVPAVRRARLRAMGGAGDGPGIVKVDEGRVLFMGPVTGGTVALRELTHLSLRRAEDGSAAWVLVDPAALITVPTDAAGADALLDAFSVLDGLTPERLRAALARQEVGTEQLWLRDRTKALPPTS